jgi:ABC-type uncharacterized transport system substrate-binding protein
VTRREFITLLGGVAAWPLAVRAQQAAVPVIGFLHTPAAPPGTPSEGDPSYAAFLKGLEQAGFVEGRSVRIEYRWAEGHFDRLPALAADLVRQQVNVLVAGGGEPSPLAAKAATSAIPIVFVIGSDPVKAGLAASYNRPGGNATSINILSDTLEPKRLGLLSELVPQAVTIGILLNPNFQPAAGQLRDLQEAGRGQKLHVLHAGTDRDLDASFETIAQQRIAALVVTADPFFDTRRDKLVALAARHAVPTIYHFREFAEAGGLMSYGIDSLETYRQVGVYTGQILKGAKPADLPVLQPSKFEFVINLKAAKALGVKFSDNLLSLADEVIE